MKIAILGGGVTGLVAMNRLLKKGHRVELFEAETELGGLAGGFKGEGWDWSLERAYHHVFSSDKDILRFSKEIGFKGFFFSEPQTASLYHQEHNYRIIPVDTPQDFLRFPLLSLPVKLRSAAVLGFLKLSPLLSAYEKTTAAAFLKKGMGEDAWNILWNELFRKKFGRYAEKILASFIWARITKRTKSLGYVRGGFQELVEFLANANRTAGGRIKKESRVIALRQQEKKMVVCFDEKGKRGEGFFDKVVSTLPTPVLLRVGGGLFPGSYTAQLKKLKYLNAVNVIFETVAPVLEKTYWLNVCDKEMPIMGLIQHTNFISKQHYANHHLLYAANYVEKENPLFLMTKEAITALYLPHLLRLNKKIKIIHTYLFRAAFAQPIFDRDFPHIMPQFETPNKNILVANLDMTYPYDRGTNYAVKLGREVAGLI